SVKTLVMRSVPDVATRLVMLKRGEADIAYAFASSMAEEIKRTPGLTLRPFYPPFVVWLLFAEQWDPKSLWSDRRVRLAANLAIDREAINQAETLGLSKLTASIIPRSFEGYWPAPLYAYVASTGPFTYGTYPDIEGLMREVASEVDRGKRETILHRVQQLIHEKVMYAPLWEQAGIGAFGPRVAEPAIGLITNMATSAPYEELRLKGK